MRSDSSPVSDRTLMKRRLVLGALVMVLTACGGDGGGVAPSPPTSIRLSPDSSALWDGDTLRFTATVLNSKGEVVPRAQVVWTSGTSPEITIDVNGLATVALTGPSPDTITVSISASVVGAPSVVATRSLKVLRVPPSVVHFLDDTTTLYLDETTAPRLDARNARNAVLHRWQVAQSSSDPTVATVSVDGIVTTKGLGTTQIIATAGPLADTTTIVVVRPFTQLAAGGAHVCGITGLHRLYCWGAGLSGEADDGDVPRAGF